VFHVRICRISLVSEVILKGQKDMKITEGEADKAVGLEVHNHPARPQQPFSKAFCLYWVQRMNGWKGQAWEPWLKVGNFYIFQLNFGRALFQVVYNTFSFAGCPTEFFSDHVLSLPAHLNISAMAYLGLSSQYLTLSSFSSPGHKKCDASFYVANPTYNVMLCLPSNPLDV